jgi:hypothetical protein
MAICILSIGWLDIKKRIVTIFHSTIKVSVYHFLCVFPSAQDD